MTRRNAAADANDDNDDEDDDTDDADDDEESDETADDDDHQDDTDNVMCRMTLQRSICNSILFCLRVSIFNSMSIFMFISVSKT